MVDKLRIETDTGVVLHALFNPNKIEIQRLAHWEENKSHGHSTIPIGFRYGRPQTLTATLVFDTYEQRADVRTLFTDAIVDLTRVPGDSAANQRRPPVCTLIWGERTLFVGVLERVDQSFTLFLENGTPVRANVVCRFKEWSGDEDDAGSSDREVTRTRTVREGDTLSGIAAEEYGDPTAWRRIAEANAIDDPTRLEPGVTLIVPAGGR